MKSKRIIILLAIFSLGAIFQAFVFSIQPTSVYAAPIDDKREDTCNSNEHCVKGFDEGRKKYNEGKRNLEEACGKRPTGDNAGQVSGGNFVPSNPLLFYNGCKAAFEFMAQEGEEKTPEAEPKCKQDGFEGEALETCTRAYLNAQAGKDQDEECARGKFSTDERHRACVRGFELAGGAEPDEETNPQVDCDLKANSALSWIVCPIIDMGVNMTDWVFEGIIRPLLEDVPVSTEAEDGSYKAWTQFRLIANILLVGTLLAIVYSQARGGGGGR